MEFLKDYADYLVFSILGLMSFLALWFSVERAIFFKNVDLNSFEDLNSLEEASTKNLTSLYIIYSNAPYIGLLGTVVGIIITFYDMGIGFGMDAKSIMVGLSLALKATAFGLLVAIPTLMVYNIFIRKVDLLSNRYKSIKGKR